MSPAAWLVHLLCLGAVQESEPGPPPGGTLFLDLLVLDPWSRNLPWEQPSLRPFVEVDQSLTRPWYAMDTATGALNPFLFEPGMRELLYSASDDWLGLLPEGPARAQGLAAAGRIGPWGMPSALAANAGPQAQQGRRAGGGATGAGAPKRGAPGSGGQARGVPDPFAGLGLPAAGGGGRFSGTGDAASLLDSVFGGTTGLGGPLLAPAVVREKGIDKETAQSVLSQFDTLQSRPARLPEPPPEASPEPSPTTDAEPVTPPVPPTDQEGNPPPVDPGPEDAVPTLDAGVLAQLKAAFQALDGDGNGTVSLAEAKTGGTFPMGSFQKLDADQDGEVTQAEFDAGIAAVMAPRQDRRPPGTDPGPVPALPANAQADFFRLDQDQDGAVSLAEYDAAGGLPTTFFVQLDANKDQRIDPDEFTAGAAKAMAATQKTRAKGPEGPAAAPALSAAQARALFKGLDGDQDGQVTFEEFAQAGNLPAAFFAHVDRDKDQALTEAELLAAPAMGDQKAHKDQGEEDPARLDEAQIDRVLTQLPSSLLRRIFTTLDTDHDEVVRPREFEQSALLPAEVFRRFDQDQDGLIQKGEFLAVVELLTQRD